MSMRSGAVLLWGGMVGILLTGGLLYVLASYSQTGMPATRSEPEPKPVIPAKTVPVQPLTPPATDTATRTGQAKPVSPPRPAPVPAPAIPPLVLPENLLLSDKDVAALSDAERKQYREMLESYQKIQAQAARLQQERDRLSQRMGDMENRNQSLSDKLEQMREQFDEDGHPK